MNERFENDLACYLHYDDAPRRPARARRRKRARKHCARRFFARCCGVLCLCAGVVLLARVWPALVSVTPYSGAGTGGASASVSLGGEWDAQTRLAIETLAAAHPEVQPMLDEPSRWPADVAALLARNEEALGFVLAYPSLIDAAPPARVEEAVRGSFPTLLQWDARWGCTPYGGSILAITGCGPTALSVVACGLTGDASLTPAAIAAWAQRQGYAGADGTSWELMRSGCEHFGLYAQELSLTEAAVFGALEAGRPIICSMRPGDFTTAGHFIVLTGTQDGLLCVVDPNSPARSASLWEYSRLEPQIKNLWAYTA